MMRPICSCNAYATNQLSTNKQIGLEWILFKTQSNLVSVLRLARKACTKATCHNGKPQTISICFFDGNFYNTLEHFQWISAFLITTHFTRTFKQHKVAFNYEIYSNILIELDQSKRSLQRNSVQIASVQCTDEEIFRAATG